MIKILGMAGLWLMMMTAAMALPPPAAVHHPVAQGRRGAHPAVVGGPARPHGTVGGPKEGVLF
jgi:hypothetical protein